MFLQILVIWFICFFFTFNRGHILCLIINHSEERKKNVCVYICWGQNWNSSFVRTKLKSNKKIIYFTMDFSFPSRQSTIVVQFLGFSPAVPCVSSWDFPSWTFCGFKIGMSRRVQTNYYRWLTRYYYHWSMQPLCSWID